jgi:hypothetical protein
MLRLGRYAAQFFSDFGFAASRRTVQSWGPEVVRQTRATIERTRLIPQARMAIRLVEQRDPSVLPLLRIDVLAAPKVGQRGFVVAEMPMDYSPRIESCLRRGKRDHSVKVIESSLRVTKVHPYKVSPEVRLSVSRILPESFVHNLKVTLRVSATEVLKFEHFFGRCWFLHPAPSSMMRLCVVSVAAAVLRDSGHHAFGDCLTHSSVTVLSQLTIHQQLQAISFCIGPLLYAPPSPRIGILGNMERADIWREKRCRQDLGRKGNFWNFKGCWNG